MPTLELERPAAQETETAPSQRTPAQAAAHGASAAPSGAPLDAARPVDRRPGAVRSVTSIVAVAVLIVAANLVFHSLGQSPTNGLARWQAQMILDADNVRFAAGWLVSLLFLAGFALLRIYEAQSTRA